MPELLFEIGTEELPSWYVTQARNALRDGLKQRLEQANLAHGAISAYATPRRLAVIAKGLADATERRTEKRRGPSADVAFDKDGQPTRAALGFAQSSGVEARDLITEETDKGSYIFAIQELGGEPVEALLPPLLTALVETLAAPRKMRWAEIETPFVRPVAWLLALLDGKVLNVKAAGHEAKHETYGHRFLAPEAVRIGSSTDYLERLEEAYVLADIETRQDATWQAAQEAAQTESLSPIDNADLRAEVANIVEYPFGVLGHFDESYLALPEEVLTTVMIHHQRYFPTRDASGKLAPYFVSISNNKVADPQLIRKGYEQVLGGRLYDARFFWDSDREKSLSQHAWSLSGIGFQKDLGTMADKTARVAETAERIADLRELSKQDKKVLKEALPIFRADLGTEMVYELPELEGIMARAYALEEGYSEEVAYALEHGVLPKGPGSPIPSSSTGALLSIADRFDKLVGFFAIGKRPTGSADPFGLRRDANALVRTLNGHGWQQSVSELAQTAAESFEESALRPNEETVADLTVFIWDRVASLLHEEGIRIELVRAAVADNPAVITATRRCHLLQALSQEEDFPDLMALYKRAANLAEQAPKGIKVRPKAFIDPHAEPLFAALNTAKGALSQLFETARASLQPWDLGHGPSETLTNLEDDIAGILALKGPLDAFLDNVLVMVEDKQLRHNRLALLKQVRDALRELGYLEELEGI